MTDLGDFPRPERSVAVARQTPGATAGAAAMNTVRQVGRRMERNENRKSSYRPSCRIATVLGSAEAVLTLSSMTAKRDVRVDEIDSKIRWLFVGDEL